MVLCTFFSYIVQILNNKAIAKNNIIKFFYRRNNSSGFTFIELLVVMVLAGILSSMGAIKFSEFNNPLKTDTASFKNFIGKVKLKAMSNTKAFKIVCDDVKTVKVYGGQNCDTKSWEIMGSDIFKLSDEVSFSQIDWSVCFNSRGFPSNSLDVSLIDNKEKQKDVSLLLGGSFYEEH